CSPRGSGELLLAGSSSVLRAGASILCLRLTLVETAGSPRFLGNPFANMLCSPTPADCMHQAPCDARDVAFRAADDVGSAFSHVSRLNHTACSLAVYASQLGLLRSTPRKTRFPLAANLGGAGLSPAGLLQEGSTTCFNSPLF